MPQSSDCLVNSADTYCHTQQRLIYHTALWTCCHLLITGGSMAYTVYTTARQGRAILDIKQMHANLGRGKDYRRSDLLATTHA